MPITERFLLVDTQGRRHHAVKIQHRIDTDSYDGPGEELWSLPEYRLGTGEALNHKEGTFTVVQTGMTLTRV